MTIYVYRNGRMVDKATGEPMNPEPVNGAFPCPSVAGDIEEYVSPATGRHITTRQAMKDDLAKSNCVDGRDVPKREGFGKLRNERFAKKRGLEHLLMR